MSLCGHVFSTLYVLLTAQWVCRFL
uniref:Uncharacterized protein n=1 Tax=Anguilla anguilla TaxID=7936 RepID=A0A0E9VQW2_ANGAN